MTARVNRRAAVMEQVWCAADRAERKHGDGWCGSPRITHARRLAIVMGELGEVAEEVVSGNDRRMREEVLDAMGALLGWLEVLT